MRTVVFRGVLIAALACAVGMPLFAQAEPLDALQAYRDGNFAEAVRITLIEIEAGPNNIESYVVLGWALNALGRHADAVDYGLRALRINQFESRILQIVAEAHFAMRNDLEALDYLERYVRVAPSGSYIDWAYYAMGEVLARFGEYHRADIALTTSVFHNSRNATRWARLGFVREQLADWRGALAAYDRALQLNPNLTAAIQGRQRAQAALSG